ncbi:Putative RNA-directed DNA polymerase from transposon BS-like Protein [Caligus rogercresseyi]|uniref:RNA-directed DNA polymerase from transposon BS-like Protein n=1 Tax=Caligus rogercresseyi TaxID=217165 RepID=A0A7T8H1Q2_CALRO|nr:Putative RNA-directed DNA polymerase from transposon BS-like Protein [Caligus rogercresseyi]
MAQDNGSKVAIAAFDYSAAFDTISPSALLDKLQWMEIGAHTLIGSYMKADLPEKVCKTASNLAGLGVFLYADDTSVTVEATTWDDVKAATRALEEDMNPQTIGTLGLLGVEIDRNGAFGTHHANVLNELRKENRCNPQACVRPPKRQAP